ncbi:trigger factor [candidate division KSB1 bacterium]|nr:trigger factor [candidate division KSB1 bacterium]
MKAEVNELKSWKMEIKVEVEADELKPIIQKTISTYQNKARLDGFRKGKAPIHIVLKQFGPSIQADVTEDAVQTFFAKAVHEKDIPVVSVGMIKDASEISLEDPDSFSFKAEVEVRPEISVRHYKGFKVEKEIYPVHKEDVDHIIEVLRHQNAEFIDVEGDAKMGDVVEGNIQQLDTTGVPVIGQKWEDRSMMLGQPPLGDQVGDQLVGIKIGEDRPFTVTSPQSEQNPNPAQELYSIHVKTIKEKRLPELDEAFVKKVGQVETVQEFMDRIESNLKMQHEENSEKLLRHRIADEIIRKNDFELPPSMIENSLNSLWERYQQNPQANVDEKQYKEENRAGVIWNLKWEMLLHKIAEEESLTVTDEAVEQEIDKAASASPKDEKKIRALFKDHGRKHGLRDQMLEEETMRFLKEHIKIKEVKVKKSKSNKSSIIMP